MGDAFDDDQEASRAGRGGDYGPKARSAVAGFCARQLALLAEARNRSGGGGGAAGDDEPPQCTAEGVAAIYEMVDEGHRAGQFGRIFPPVGARGCGRYCAFLTPAAPEDRLLWAFLRTHGAIMPRRTRLPTPKDKDSESQGQHQ